MDIQAYINSGIIETYVLGLANAEETAEVEKLASMHPEVQQAIDNFSEMLEQQAFENAVTPPAGLKEKILDAIKEDEDDIALIPVIEANKPVSDTPVAPVVSMERSSLRTWKMIAAASIILFVASAAYNLSLYSKYSQASNQYQALLLERNTLQANNEVIQTKLQEMKSASSMMADPAMLMIKMPEVPGKDKMLATLLWDTRTKDVYVMPNQLPSLNTNQQYQLWAIVDGKPVDAGLLDPGCTSVCKLKNITKAQAFAITIEKAGGSPTPNLDQMMVMGKV